MKTSVIMDEVGRLVLPKNIREAMGFVGRMVVNVDVVDNVARITNPKPTASVVIRKRGRLVYAGPLPTNWDSGDAVLAMRQRRLRR